VGTDEIFTRQEFGGEMMRRRLLNGMVVLIFALPVAGLACDGEAEIETDTREGESGESGEGNDGEGDGADVEVETE
jgi:hypothetical protein